VGSEIFARTQLADASDWLSPTLQQLSPQFCERQGNIGEQVEDISRLQGGRIIPRWSKYCQEYPRMLNEQIDAAMAVAFSTPMPCILCGGKPDLLGVWIPNAKGAQMLNVPVNKQRLIPYWICAECKKLPNSLVEAVITSQMPTATILDWGEEAPIPRSSKN
jgi:hypothetical protein